MSALYALCASGAVNTPALGECFVCLFVCFCVCVFLFCFLCCICKFSLYIQK